MRARLKPLSRQTIVITGATSGIGLATAELAVRRGAAVMLASRNEEALNDVGARLRALGGRVRTCRTDVTDRAQVEALADRTARDMGGFDSWVNDASASIYGKLTDISMEDHRHLFDTGYWGTVYGSLAAVRHLKERGGGALINVGSVLSERAINMQGAYSAMKHAVKGFTEALRMELEQDGAGISVTLIKPGSTNTPFPEHARNLMGQPARVPPVVYDPRVVARAILFTAEKPRRELTVGGASVLSEKLPALFPRLADLLMEAGGASAQQTSEPPPPARRDNLWEPREDALESGQHIRTRRHSMLLEAQMHPLLATLAVAGAAAALSLIGGSSRRAAQAGARRREQARLRELPPERLYRERREPAAPVS